MMYILLLMLSAFILYLKNKLVKLMDENRELKYRNQQLTQQKNQWKRQSK